MTISKCEFEAPKEPGTVADITVILDGILVLSDLSIIRERNLELRRDKYCVTWPDTFFFSDDYAENLFESEILCRYDDWLEAQHRRWNNGTDRFIS